MLTNDVAKNFKSNSKVNKSFLSIIILRTYGKQNSYYLPSTVRDFRMQSIREGQIVKSHDQTKK